MANYYVEFKRLFPGVQVQQELPSCAPRSPGTKYDIDRCGKSNQFGPYWIEWSTFDCRDISRGFLSNVEWHVWQANGGLACMQSAQLPPEEIGDALGRFRASMLGLAAATYALLEEEPNPDRCPLLNTFTTPDKATVAKLLHWGFPGASIDYDRHCATLGLFRVELHYGQSRQPITLALVGPVNVGILRYTCKDQVSVYQALVMMRAWLLSAADATMSACQTPKPLEIEAVLPPEEDEWD